MHGALLPVVVFVIVYVAITFELVNKAVAALLGVMILLSLHIVSEHEAVELIDFETIMLLLGMMMGFLPCGLSFAAFTRALPSGNPIYGAALVLQAFGNDLSAR